MGGYANSQNGLMSGRITNSCEIINVVSRTSRQVAPMHDARAEFQALVLPNGNVLVVSGIGDGDYTSGCEVYDPARDTWTIVGYLNTPRRQHAAAMLDDHRVLVVGGMVWSASGSSIAEILDIATGTATTVTPYPFAFNLGVAGYTSRGHVLVTGGRIAGASSLRNNEVYWYDTTNDAWVFTGNLRYRECVIVPVQLLDGRLLLAGGSLDDFAPGAGDDIEIETGDTMRVLGHFARPRTWHCACQWNVDTVVAFGGHDYTSGGAPFSSSEWIDVRSGTSTLGPDMSVARKYAAGAAVRVPSCWRTSGNPGILAIGGLDASGHSTSSVEILGSQTNALTPRIQPINSLRLCGPGDSITLDAGAGYGSYAWSTGDTSRSIVVRTPGISGCTVHVDSCSGSAQVQVTRALAPTITGTGALTCAPDDSVTLTLSSGYQSYLWSTGSRAHAIVVHAPGTYSATVTDTGGCVFTVAYTVTGVAGIALAVDTTLEGNAWWRDTLWTGHEHCGRVWVRNTGVSPAALTRLALRSGMPVTVPAGQLPRTVDPGTAVAIVVCLTRTSVGRVFDTLDVGDTCTVASLPITLTSADLPSTGLCHPYQELDTTALAIASPYPNPATSTLAIPIAARGMAGSARIVRVRLESMLGELIATRELRVTAGEPSGGEASFDVARLATGVYRLRIDDGRRVTSRIVVVSR